MPFWLFKEEPTHYSFSDLERDGHALWSGVTNAMARIHLRRIRPKDKVFYYHTGSEKAIVGIMSVIQGNLLDPTVEDTKGIAVEVKPSKRLRNPVLLSAIKADPFFSDWELVRNSRLSVMPVSEKQWQRIEELSQQRSENCGD